MKYSSRENAKDIRIQSCKTLSKNHRVEHSVEIANFSKAKSTFIQIHFTDLKTETASPEAYMGNHRTK